MGIVLMLSATPSAHGSWVESLVMPGDVIDGHADFETDCSACHEKFDKTGQDRLCLACHKTLAADIKAHVGYHGRASAVRNAVCKSCHTDHIGRDAHIVVLDTERFDHDDTDFPLHGAHATPACTACHVESEKHRGTASSCAECHRQDDPHQGALGASCQDCHGDSSWKETRFNHETARFALRGKHVEVQCERCHPTQTFRPTAMLCVDCHLKDSPHSARFGPKCDDCHSLNGWPVTRFPHLKKTGFALVGAHADSTCEACHPDQAGNTRTDARCVACHHKDDAHENRFGSFCNSCHTAQSWESFFDHDADTKYRLVGRHRSVKCNDCHVSADHEKPPDTSCYACHRADDVHHGQEGTDCRTCHSETGWRDEVFFDHDLTRFPLIGAHGAVRCKECHPTNAFKDAKLECVSCHESKDVHQGGLGRRCADCHNPTDWAFWLFDHDNQTRFALDGSHRTLACRSCHRSGLTHGTPPDDCNSCHRSDDIHAGEFGSACEQCHVTSSFGVIQRIR